MSLDEIRELLSLKKIGHEELAKMLGKTRSVIDRWFCVRQEHRRYPSSKDIDMMRTWLTEAREDTIRRWAANGTTTNGHAKKKVAV